ncbi:chondroitin sulfate proteoglycan 4 [Copidosoma floridanum]|uniref:chondroitin sulfate proteoglycan 4 n=1 Tax=Copidosoma floridanum TaxID=29053 RepID=UPI0006C9CE57|nr:chondroitin sulfate proteoglycan 4 [Copidosoma floridanum]
MSGAMTLMLLLLSALTAGLLLDSCQADEKASFYGASYIHLSVQEARSATDISFRFRTHLADAMLLLTAGRTDYCLIKLESGGLKVHINLGAGEKELASARELKLNDLSWHEVNLTRRDANITLRIDVIHSVSDVLPGKFFELNINFGVYIGGQGRLSELFLGHTEYLRGCMADIIYNGIRVIEQTRRRNSSEATAVNWGCSAEFDASYDAEVSFVEDGAFAALPRNVPRSGSRWEVELKTAAQSGLLLFNAGRSTDFLGVELEEGRVRLLMNKGTGPTELVHGRTVADGHWHRLAVDFTPSFVGISVDGEPRNMSLPASNRYLDLADTFYVGGTELNRRAKALAKGLKSGDLSYRGCLRAMVLGGHGLGLPHVKVSQGLVAGCVWRFPCTEADTEPCVPGASCSQLGVRSFKCTCDQSLCIRPNFTDEHKLSVDLPVSLEVLALRPLQVVEARRAVLGERQLAMVLDIAKYGLDESNVVFLVVGQPAHGVLLLDKAPLPAKATFTLNDVYQHRITYQHDGGESTGDSAILKVALQQQQSASSSSSSSSGVAATSAGGGGGVGVGGGSSRQPLPGYFQDSLRFTLHVNVTPVNDPPRLEIPTNSQLRLAQASRKALTKELLWAVDADTPAGALVYTVLANDTDAGHVERLGQTVDTFTQADLERGFVDYVHSGKDKTKAVLGLRVSDGEASSGPQYLRVSTYPLSIRPKVNTGLVVVHRSFSYLSPANLSFVTNAEDPRVDLRYAILKQPQYGVIQRQREPGQPWMDAEYFTSRDLELQTVRYLHTTGSPRHDSFKFQASVREVRPAATYDFNVTFIILELLEINRHEVNFTGTADVVVEPPNLSYQTNPLPSEPTTVLYSLLEPSHYGHLYLDYDQLSPGQTFTQHDINTARLRYRLHRRAYSPVEDAIGFKVSAPQCSDLEATLNFRYLWPVGEPPSPPLLLAESEALRVAEGSRAALLPAPLSATYRDLDLRSLVFNLTESPRHGWLACYDGALPVRRNATHFTLQELASQSVFYVHDDSESASDGLEYLALTSDEATDFMRRGALRVDIEARNDNAPKRLDRRVFHVVSRSTRIITRSDLRYTDDDLGTRPVDLVYKIKQLSGGEIYRVVDGSPVDRFTQQDIDDEVVAYRHRGNREFERVDFTVSDGELFANGELEIQAGRPYVKLLLSTDTLVQSNRTTYLGTKDIDAETNVHANSTDIEFRLLERLKHGTLLKFNRETEGFDMADLVRGAVAYRHTAKSLKPDQLALRVKVKDAEDRGTLAVKVLPESYWEPLLVQHNGTVYVEEATSVVISRKSLEIGHPDVPPGRVTYHIREWPKNGHLEVQTRDEDEGGNEEEDGESHAVESFEQSLVNEDRVHYVQTTPNRTRDSFVVDVSNGVVWLRNLSVSVAIIPAKLYVAARNLTVLEGKSVALRETDFYALTGYFAGKLTDYRVVEKPRHGGLVDAAKGGPVKKFSQGQLAAREIVYRNSGDEVAADRFKLAVMAGEKSSEPFDVWVNVEPVNDQVPVVVNRTRFSVWQGGSVVVGSEYLAAKDNDSAPEDLVYRVRSLANGYFSLSEAPGIEIGNFTQEMIDARHVLFTHRSGSEAEFKFTVSDGPHTTDLYSVSVSTKPIRIRLERNRVLNIFPLARKPITSDLLLAKCTDPNRDLKYVVRLGAGMGKIMMETNEGTWVPVDRFTQKDLNDSRVSYEHVKSFNNINASDSFIFDVETNFANTIRDQIFNIDISISSGGLHRYVSFTPVQVIEGGSSTFGINISEIVTFLRTKAAIANPDVFVRLIRQPSYGHVMLLPDLNITTFSESEARSGKIAYFHDHSDTLRDQIDFTVYVSPGHVVLCNVSVPVDVAPINDQPFKLEVIKDIDVVQNQTQTITRDNLLTTDPDTEPKDIIYEIINAPTYGRLLLLSADSNSNTKTHQPKNFTQQDVDSSRLVYEHRGPLLLSTFYFRVSDGHFNHDYKIFNINVHPIRLAVSVARPVEIQQGLTSTTIDTESLKLETNVRPDLVRYEVTRAPRHGALHIREQSNNFRHTDLLSKSIVYVQQDMTASNDSLELSARVSEFELRGISVPIRVVPLMIISPSLEVYAGERTRLGIGYFDATPLAKLAGSDPVFRVTRRPRFAKIMRIMNRTVSSGEKKRALQEQREIGKFSHSQVLSGVVYLVCTNVPSNDVNGVSDGFEFVLVVPHQTAFRFQPAVGSFEFRLKLSSDYYNNSLEPMDPVGHEGEMTVAPSMANDYTLLIGALAGIFVLALCIIVTIRCRHGRGKKKKKKPSGAGESSSSSIDPAHQQDAKVEPACNVSSLPRPPDHLLPATPHLKRYCAPNDVVLASSISSSTPLPPLMGPPTLTSTLPQCKVIALSPMDSIMGSDVDVSARYPYGVGDADEWSSFETTDLPCPSHASQPPRATPNNPLLRKNQYWV